MDKEKFSEVIQWLAAVYPNKEIGGDTVNAYYMLLEDLDPDLLQAAAIKCASLSPFVRSLSLTSPMN